MIKVYDMQEVKTKLKDYPTNNYYVRSYASELEKRLKEKCDALNWLLTMSLLSTDLTKGINTYTGERFSGAIGGLSAGAYKLIENYIGNDQSLLPKEMYSEVQAECKAVTDLI